MFHLSHNYSVVSGWDLFVPLTNLTYIMFSILVDFGDPEQPASLFRCLKINSILKIPAYCFNDIVFNEVLNQIS